MPEITMLIKPASSLCNLRCKYCFYHEEARQREIPSYGIMTLKTAEKLIIRAFEEASGRVGFAFQGGEPTLAGLDFFESFIGLVNKHNVKKLPVSYSIQTNGILTAEKPEYAEFFARHKFLVGLSADGTKELHDLNRIYPDGSGTYSTVLKASRVLTKAGADYNILTVINSRTARHGTAIYNAYRKNGWDYMQFIPCLGDDAPDDKTYGDFLCATFELWYKDMMSGKKVSIRLFDNLLNMIAGYPPETCGMTGICSIQYVAEADGGIYPCDFYCMDEYKLGNLNDMGLRELFESERAQNFIKRSCRHLDECKACKWYPVCRGGCMRYKDEYGKYIYCGAFTRFMEHSYRGFVDIIRKLQSESR